VDDFEGTHFEWEAAATDGGSGSGGSDAPSDSSPLERVRCPISVRALEHAEFQDKVPDADSASVAEASTGSQNDSHAPVQRIRLSRSTSAL
jgi:hypothetical protein